MIKAVIFDMGGVFINCDGLIEHTKKVFGLEEIDAEKFWQELSIENLPLCRGEISLYEFWKRLAKKYGKNVDEKTLRELWIKDFDKLTRVDEDVKGIVRTLKRNYKVGVISNTIREHEEVNKKLGRFELFDVVVNSHNVGVTKEDERIFLIALERFGMKAEECVFVDDVQKFVEVARKVGMKGIVFRDAGQLREELGVLGVVV